MGKAQDIIDAVTAETTAVDSVIAYIRGLVANNTITDAQAADILAHINANRDALNGAITANT